MYQRLGLLTLFFFTCVYTYTATNVLLSIQSANFVALDFYLSVFH